MKTFFRYYVVDTITESIIGSFDALNLDMAKIVLKKGILENQKLKDVADQLALFVDGREIFVCETYDEIRKTLTFVADDHWRSDNDRRENDNGCAVTADH